VRLAILRIVSSLVQIIATAGAPGILAIELQTGLYDVDRRMVG
jgi:hypothetical protein